MNATHANVCRILWNVVLDKVIAAGLSAPVASVAEMFTTADDDALSEWGESLAAQVSGYDEGEIRAALLDYRIVRDDSGRENCPDVLAHRAELIAEHANAAHALDALQEATGTEPDADDVAMIRSANSYALATWADDLEARVGLDVQAFRDALEPVHDAAIARTCAEAAAALAPLLTSARIAAGWRAMPVDMRGAHCGGAELDNPAGDGVSFGVYCAEDDASWHVWDCYGEVDIDVTGAGGSLDADKARAAVNELINGATLAAIRREDARKEAAARVALESRGFRCADNADDVTVNGEAFDCFINAARELIDGSAEAQQ